MGLVQWSPLNNVPLWPRHILTIILVIIVAFLLDRLLVLPIDRLRLKFGAKPRIDRAFSHRTKIRRQARSGVSKWPAASALLDHLIGGNKQFVRDRNVQRLCSFQIDDQFEFGRGLHRELAGLSPLRIRSAYVAARRN